MILKRVIPVLLLRQKGLVKSVRFRDHIYVGDPINAVKIFNEKEVDELVLLDIDATSQKRGPDFNLLTEIASECFMPLTYGGGITGLGHIEKLNKIGIEKVAINSFAGENPFFIKEASAKFGSTTIVVSMDVKKDLLRRSSVYIRNGNVKIKTPPVEYARKMEDLGAGELLLNSIDRDGSMMGYDLDLIHEIASALTIPVIACGGAGSFPDLKKAIDANASAVAAGSMFVFHGKHKAVLISYPTYPELIKLQE